MHGMVGPVAGIVLLILFADFRLIYSAARLDRFVRLDHSYQ